MGRRGPSPKPTALKLLAGNPGKRRLNTREPRPAKTAPRCPGWLGAEAKAVWKGLVPDLRRMGVLTVVDGEALASFCQTYVRWREAEDFLDKHGSVYPIRDERGQVRCMQQFPQVSIARNLILILKSFYGEFGMTPAARTRIELPWNPVEWEHDGVCDRLGNPI